MFARDDVALIFHLKNHYALIYALREQTDHIPPAAGMTGTGTVGATGDEAAAGNVPEVVRPRPRREMLTARRGQRPAEWIPWEEARETMLRWTGYGVMAVQLKR